MYRWLVFLHILGAFGFMLGHGAATSITFRLRAERDRERIAALLGLARNNLVTGLTWASFLLLLGTGIALGFMGRWWGKGWIWISLGLLTALVIFMGYFGRGYFDPLVTGLGLPMYQGRKAETPETPLSDEDLERLLLAGRPWLLTVVGLVGWAFVLWLMMFKPF